MVMASPVRSERWELYRLLGEPARLRLLALAGEEELAVSELAELLGESQPNVSRHAAPLRQWGLLSVRKQGTWTLMSLDGAAEGDPVVADALAAGRELCERDGTLARVGHVVRAREQRTREFYARPRSGASALGPPAELGAYLAALGALLPRRGLAVDAGTGDGRSLEVLAPVFERVVALDRSEAQLALAKERVAQRGFGNVTLAACDLDAVTPAAVTGGARADLVLLARVLHHAPRPGHLVKQLARLLGEGGAMVLIDYARHEDEALREQQADLWLGFERAELERWCRAAGLEPVATVPVPAPYRGEGPDRHLVWQATVALRAGRASHEEVSTEALGASAARPDDTQKKSKAPEAKRKAKKRP